MYNEDKMQIHPALQEPHLFLEPIRLALSHLSDMHFNKVVLSSLNCSHYMLSALLGAAVNKKLLSVSPESKLSSKAAHESPLSLPSADRLGLCFVQNYLTSRSLTWKGKCHRLGCECRGSAQYLGDNRPFSMHSNCTPHPAAWSQQTESRSATKHIFTCRVFQEHISQFCSYSHISPSWKLNKASQICFYLHKAFRQVNSIPYRNQLRRN